MLSRQAAFLLFLQLLAIVGVTLLLARGYRQNQVGIEKPNGLEQPPIGSIPNIPGLMPPFPRPVLLHFLNPECPCSRFNFDHLAELTRRYAGPVDQRVVMISPPDHPAVSIWRHQNIGLPVMMDAGRMITRECGVYCTPQAVLLNTDGRLIYRGNYNRARYCLDPATAFVQQTLDCLIAHRPLPPLTSAMTDAYGCPLPTGPEVDE